MRRVACFNIDEFETAKDAFEKGYAIEPANAQFKTWIRKCDAELEEEEEDSGPPPAVPAARPAPAAVTVPPPSQPVAPAAPKPRFRHEYYQNSSSVVVTVYIKVRCND